MKKSITIFFVLITLVGSWICYRLYNKPHRDPATESSIQITAFDLLRIYESDEVEANRCFLDKVLEVSGKITEITTNQESFPVVVLETENAIFTVRCTMENPEIQAKVGEIVKIKGICTGYLSDVIIVNGMVVE